MLKPQTIEHAERDLTKLLDWAAALKTEIDSLAAREDDLEEAGELVMAQAETRAARNRLRKLQPKIAGARERLAEVKAAARTKLRRELMAAFDPVARDFLAKAQAAQAALGPVVAAREAVRAAGFSNEYLTLPLPPHINGIVLPAPDLLQIFMAGLDGSPRMTAPRRLAQALIVPRSSAGDGPHYPWRSSEPKSPAKPKINEIAVDGETLVYVLRNGLEIGGRQLRIGDVVAVSDQLAKILERNGAVAPKMEDGAPATMGSAAPAANGAAGAPHSAEVETPVLAAAE